MYNGTKALTYAPKGVVVMTTKSAQMLCISVISIGELTLVLELNSLEFYG